LNYSIINKILSDLSIILEDHILGDYCRKTWLYLKISIFDETNFIILT